MATDPYKVCVVVDREFGERLAKLVRGVPVWIVDTPTNTPVAQRLWKERSGENYLTGITTFKAPDSFSPADMLLDELDTIDLHHGSYSAHPAYTVIEVLGAPLSAKANTKLSEYGFNEFHPELEGFTATRPELRFPVTPLLR